MAVAQILTTAVLALKLSVLKSKAGEWCASSLWLGYYKAYEDAQGIEHAHWLPYAFAAHRSLRRRQRAVRTNLPSHRVCPLLFLSDIG